MPDALPELASAVDAGDPVQSRHALRTVPPEHGDNALALLAGRAAEGSALATELLVEQLDESGVIRRFVSSTLLDESAVDDVSQDVLISVAGSIQSFKGESKVTTWVHSIVRHRVVDHLRRQRATTPLPEDDLGPAQRMSSLLATRATVQAALAGLPDLYRAPVALRDLEGLSYAEVAERLDRNVGTVKAQISRGRALVASTLKGEEWA
ncbi:RNA polymerase sigma factor [Ornithinimicrobium pratense]|uniref:RNA polymerase sigma factor n=1 Tax=Ornithinimicrobium pratense TaxID=2593973 RepID=A0A5J6V6G9_9MICO|nr:RNA polymerase sigma factor [Ornithinimicrobium pratense]QFG69375.1 RNA polymerase sigma factor [Ornithinimicrobium pratense]